MAYKVIILYRLYMPSYFLGTFTEYPYYILILALTLLFFYQHNQRSAFKRSAIAFASSLA